MSLSTRSPAPERANPPDVTYYRLTVRQFKAMIAAGVFPEGARVELLGGMLIDQMTKNQPHNIASGQARDALLALVPPGWFVDEEKPVRIGRNDRPETYVTVVRGCRQDYREGPPRPADLALLVEVADVSYAKDRGRKWKRYAAARVATYWIIHLDKRQVEVYSSPEGRGRNATYRDCAIFGPDDAVPLVIAGREVGRIAVRGLLP